MKRRNILLINTVLFGFISCSSFSFNDYYNNTDSQASFNSKLNSKLEDELSLDDNSRFEHHDIKLIKTPEVKKYISLYTGIRRRDIEVPLKLRSQYLPTIERVLSYYKLPLNLSNLAFVESKFDLTARSPRGAVGLWQFMKPTAKSLGLECSYWNDEREDVVRSSIAAAKYLKKLRNRFDDWLLAVAAYNAGPARVSAAIKKAGGERDFYKIARQNLLPSETVDHVSKFIAVSMITSNLHLYDFNDSDNTLAVLTTEN